MKSTQDIEHQEPPGCLSWPVIGFVALFPAALAGFVFFTPLFDFLLHPEPQGDGPWWQLGVVYLLLLLAPLGLALGGLMGFLRSFSTRD